MPFGIPSEDFHGGFGLPHDEDNVIDIHTKEQKRLDAKYNNHPTIKELADQWYENRLQALDDLHNVSVELDARETSSNCVIPELTDLSWDEVCDRGIELLQKLKEPWKE